MTLSAAIATEHEASCQSWLSLPVPGMQGEMLANATNYSQSLVYYTLKQPHSYTSMYIFTFMNNTHADYTITPPCPDGSPGGILK